MDDQGEPIVEHDFLVRDIDVLGLRQCAESADGRNQQQTTRTHELLLSKNVGRRTEPLVRAYPEFGGNRVRRKLGGSIHGWDGGNHALSVAGGDGATVELRSTGQLGMAVPT